MFLKKLISSLFLSPLLLIILLLPVFFIKELKKNKKIKIYILIFFIFLYFFSIDLGKNLLFYPLEKDYINYNLKKYLSNIKNQKIDLIVILSGGGDYRYQLSEDSYDRLILSYMIYKSFNCDIFLSGGSLIDNPNFKLPVSEIMYFYLTNLGVNKNSIFLDNKALDTFQNIKNLKKFLTNKKYKNILIITSAYHILRVKLLVNHIFKENTKIVNNSEIKFIFQGCSLKYSEFYDKYSFIPSFYNLYLSFIAIKEYFGIIYYYLYFNRFFIKR